MRARRLRVTSDVITPSHIHVSYYTSTVIIANILHLEVHDLIKFECAPCLMHLAKLPPMPMLFSIVLLLRNVVITCDVSSKASTQTITLTKGASVSKHFLFALWNLLLSSGDCFHHRSLWQLFILVTVPCQAPCFFSLRVAVSAAERPPCISQLNNLLSRTFIPWLIIGVPRC